jgi:glycosyltransferase involved in cell wall biosynthesis
MGRLIYLPLEPYIERYTWFMSCKDGWAETWFKNLKVNFERIEGVGSTGKVNTGYVLDAFGRSIWAMSQIQQVCVMIQNGCIKDDDVIYTEDFWHPGIESLFYIRNITKIKYKVCAFIHAQTVDRNDFTVKTGMTPWMRDIEKGYGRGYDYIFTSSPILASLCAEAGIAHVMHVGHCYHSSCLFEQTGIYPKAKEPFVLFSSRLDPEKDPNFLIDVAEACKDIYFIIANPRAVLTYDKEIQKRLVRDNIEVVNTKGKKDYYDLLARAKVQFNCSHQDWVSYVLLEAIQYHCNPLYPIYLDFPREIENLEYLYEKSNVEDCANHLYKLMHKEFDPALTKIVKRHDETWKIILQTMGVISWDFS